jgi:hypothetical protein
MAVERVQPVIRESTALGGDSADETDTPHPLNPNEDGIETRRVYIQNNTSRDNAVYVDRDASDNLVLVDPNAGSKTLTDLIPSGISAAAHKALRQLVHLANGGGPWEGFASAAYYETLPAADPFPTSFIWWESSAKLKKIVEETITYNSNKTTNTDQWKVYDTDGTTVLSTITDTIAYSGVFETSRTRVIT